MKTKQNLTADGIIGFAVGDAFGIPQGRIEDLKYQELNLCKRIEKGLNE